MPQVSEFSWLLCTSKVLILFFLFFLWVSGLTLADMAGRSFYPVYVYKILV